MTKPRPITLAGRPIAVPPLPLRLNMLAYPLCRELTNGALLQRIAAAEGKVDCTAEEMANLAELAFIAARAADPALEREAFEEWHITPSELLDAFFEIRYQTGGWIAVAPGEGPGEMGELKGPKKPRK